MANKKLSSWPINIVMVIIILALLLVSWFTNGLHTPEVTPTVIVPSPPPEPRREDTTLGAVSTPSVVDKTVPIVQSELVAPPPILRAEVVEVKEHVAKTAKDLTETIKEFRKEADELDLGD